jgi:ubiquinone/menaquinone biosynthesis C-methylase UbiE
MCGTTSPGSTQGSVRRARIRCAPRLFFLMQSDPWSEASRARVSDRWAEAAAGWKQAPTDVLIAAAAIEPESLVLDLACGSGDPALDIVQQFASVRVIGVDRSSAGLVLARQNAERARVGSRIAFMQGDVQALPVASECVDRITCRFGVMFFQDAERAMREMRRVLKPGGRVALLVWGVFQQPFFEATIGAVLQLVPGAELPEAARLMSRFAAPGSLAAELRKAGFCSIRETEMTLPRIWTGSAEQLWEYQQEVSTPCRPLFEKIPAALRPRIDSQVAARLAQFNNGGRLEVPAQVVLATAAR